MGVYRKQSKARTQGPSLGSTLAAGLAVATQGRYLLRAGLVVLLLAAWLNTSRFSVQGEVPLEVLVVDTSASSRLGVRDADAWLVAVAAIWLDDVRDRQGLGDPDPELMVVTFGPSASVLAGPVAGRSVPASLQRFLSTGPLAPRAPGANGAGQHQASPMDAALALAEVEFAGHRGVRVTLAGDGSYSGADPEPRLGAWGAAGISVEHAAPPRDRADLAIGNLLAPPRVFAGAPIRIGLDTYQLARHRAPGAPALRIQATFAGASAQWFEPLSSASEFQHAQLDLASPFQVLMSTGARGELHFEVDAGYLVNGSFEGDGFGANDQLAGAVLVGDAARVLVAVDEAQIDRARAFFLGQDLDDPDGDQSATNGLAYSFVTPGQVPEKLGQADALISFDLSPDDLPAERLQSFVQAGGGWFAMGGWGLLADRNVHIGTGPRHLLPLGLDEDAPLRDVILVVDGSGSMEGEPFEVVRRGALELVNGAPATDEVRLVFFTDALGIESRIRPAFAGDATRALSGSEIMRRAKEAEVDLAVLMSTQVPGGNTHVVDALDELANMRVGSRREALVLLLTDGQETRRHKNDPAEPGRQRAGARRVAGELMEVGARLVVIGVGAMELNSDPDLFLRALLQAGESVVRCGLEAGDEQRLGELLRREANRDRVWEGGFGVARLGAAGSFEQQLLPPKSGDLLPGVFRLGRYSLKPNATLLAAAEGTKPLLAATRRGGGRTAALATLPRSPWAPGWTDARELEALITWLADRPRQTQPTVVVERRGEAWLVLDGLAGQPMPSGYALEIRTTSLGKQGRFAPSLGTAPLAKVRASLMTGAPGTLDSTGASGTSGSPGASGTLGSPGASGTLGSPGASGTLNQRYGAPLPAAAADALAAGATLEVRVLDPDPGTRDPVLATLALGAPATEGEGAPGRPRLDLARLAAAAQGADPLATLAAPESRPREQPHPLAPWGLGAGLGLIFLGGLKAFGPTGR